MDFQDGDLERWLFTESIVEILRDLKLDCYEPSASRLFDRSRSR